MTRATTDQANPWRASVTVAQIPQTGLHREIIADRATREAMAEIAGLREIISARASFDLTPQSRGRVQVAGQVQARIRQACVVTLEPIENDIDEDIDLVFAPAEQISPTVDLIDEVDKGDTEIADQPEPIVSGIIDLGRLATDMLLLAIDPYPRKPGAVFEPQIVAPDPEDHPFAALKTLALDSKQPAGPKRKGK